MFPPIRAQSSAVARAICVLADPEPYHSTSPATPPVAVWEYNTETSAQLRLVRSVTDVVASASVQSCHHPLWRPVLNSASVQHPSGPVTSHCHVAKSRDLQAWGGW
eukprot:1516275-Rhodomonas_salina.1